MLFPGRTDIHTVPEAVVVWPHHKAVDKPYFCPNLSCLSDDLAVRSASSFRNVWLVTEEASGATWLMMAEKPSCPHCGSTLCEAGEEPLFAQSTALPLM
ncbi:MAG TPA: hypothetical protein P5121_00110 [Caldilineaceae bacterium]|nr:hypothetical protein [Caldilineaceae bacterium]